jgi:hypothetical protein
MPDSGQAANRGAPDAGVGGHGLRDGFIISRHPSVRSAREGLFGGSRVNLDRFLQLTAIGGIDRQCRE